MNATRYQKYDGKGQSNARNANRTCGLVQTSNKLGSLNGTRREQEPPTLFASLQIYGERNVEVCPGEEQAGDEAGKSFSLLGIRDEKTRMKVTPPLAVAPLAQEDDMRWNPNQA